MQRSELEAIVAEHCDAIRAVLRALLRSPEDVEDCYQATLLIAMQRLAEVATGARRAWLVQVARNEALQLHRRRACGKEVLDDWARSSVTRTGAPEDPLTAMVSEELRSRVQVALQELSAPQREVIRMRIYEGKTFQEIADALAIPLGTALTRMRLGLAKLQDQLRTVTEPS
jgi:RNA polymerase sigma-70 factor, ECF subfamily